MSNTFRGRGKATSFLLCMHMCVDNLCGVFFEQRHAKTVCYYSVAEFFDVKCECEQEELCFCFGFSSCQKPSELEILLNYAECALDLNGSIHPKQYAFLCCDPLLCLPVLFLQLVRYANLSIESGSVTFASVRAPFATFTFVNLSVRFIPVI